MKIYLQFIRLLILIQLSWPVVVWQGTIFFWAEEWFVLLHSRRASRLMKTPIITRPWWNNAIPTLDASRWIRSFGLRHPLALFGYFLIWGEEAKKTSWASRYNAQIPSWPDQKLDTVSGKKCLWKHFSVKFPLCWPGPPCTWPGPKLRVQTFTITTFKIIQFFF